MHPTSALAQSSLHTATTQHVTASSLLWACTCAVKVGMLARSVSAGSSPQSAMTQSWTGFSPTFSVSSTSLTVPYPFRAEPVLVLSTDLQSSQSSARSCRCKKGRHQHPRGSAAVELNRQKQYKWDWLA